ncbi:hypothetical protein CALVIDRAFT_367691 [Calocera viscosa TUFC12733]|uniref:LYC1 C-terminal domain-containing protein n=1 Tax=Calocera viscosa (strain TUFC12733) TaxID=1330018 RepID=A0A167H1V8_CALVF|nr:hypothetical protein CALVIDRAFT_367691 [Calocera viscosa TUFC12733]
MASLASWTLVRANREQTIESRKRNFHEWNRGLNIDQYLKLHDDLDIYEHAADAKLNTWVLVDRNDPSSLNYLCACETYRRTGLVATSGGVKEVTAYAVASVYTPVVNRKQGYARQMLRLLHHVIGIKGGLPEFPAEWGSPPSSEGFGDGKFSILYSDVGPKFYTTCGPTPSAPGWIVQNPYEVVWTLEGHTDGDQSRVKLLKDTDLEDVLAKDAALIKKEMVGATGPCVSFTANNGVNNYLVQRSIFRTVLTNGRRADAWGAVLPEHERQPFSFLTWTPDPLDFTITRLRADPESLPVLIAAAKKIAAERKAVEIVAWAVPEGLQEACKVLGGVQRTRTNHLPSVHVYDADGEKFEWIHNEKFSWC